LEKVTYERNAIVTFKLVNGDEIVTRIEADDGEQWVITGPVTVIPAREGGIHMVPSMMSIDPDAELRLSRRQVMLDAPSAEPVADHYREITTGVKTVRKPGIILG